MSSVGVAARVVVGHVVSKPNCMASGNRSEASLNIETRGTGRQTVEVIGRVRGG